MRVNVDQLFTIWRKRKFFVKLLLSIIFVAVIPTLVLFTITYYKVSDSYGTTLSENHAKYLYQTINAIELIVDQIKESSQQLTLDSSFHAYRNYPNATYYENLHGSIHKTDLAANYGYLKNKSEVITTIQSFLLSNKFVESVYFFDSGKDIVLHINRNSNNQYTWNDFYDKAWYDLLELNQISPIIMETRTVETDNHKKFDYFTVIYRINNQNALIINLDAEAIYDNIIQKINQSDSIYVLSSSGHMMFPYDHTASHKEIKDFLNENTKTDAMGYFNDTFHDKEVMVTYAGSSMLDWQFFHIEDLDVLHHSLKYLQRIILLLTVTLIGLIILLAFLLSHRLYQPIKRIGNRFNLKFDKKKFTQPVDEFKHIDTIIQTTLEQRDQFKKLMEESFPTFQEKFKRELLRRSFSKKEIEEKIEYLNINIDTENVILLLFSLDDYYSLNNQVEQGELYKIQIQELIKNSPYSDRKFYMADIEEDKVAMVLNISEEEAENIETLGENILNYLFSKFNGSVTIGVSNFYTDLVDLPQAYDEANEALHYKLIFGQGRVITINEVNSGDNSPYFYPKEKIERLSDFVKVGNTSKATEVYQQLLETIDQHKKQLHYNQILPIFSQILTNLMDVLHQAEINSEDLFDNNPFSQLEKLGDIRTISAQFEQWIQMISDKIYQQMGTKGNENVYKIKSYLHEHLDLDISLNMLAEETGLNPAYISRLFKQHTGKTFIEYLKDIRIEESKELLMESKLKVKEISRQVGYQNAYYFIKVFKEKTGVTPGEFRKMNNKTFLT